MKNYEKPEIEIISLITEEKVTGETDFEGIGGTTGDESNTLDL